MKLKVILGTIFSAVALLAFSGIALAGPYDNQPTSMLFSAPANSTPGYPLVQADANQMAFRAKVGDLAFPNATAVAAATPGVITQMLASVPTVAANAGVFLPVIREAGMMSFIRNDGGNTINIYPSNNALGTPAAINAIAAGSSAALATVKTLICWSESTVQWKCTWGQAS